MVLEDHIERGRAIFNESDRKYLANVSEYINGLSRKADYDRRDAITSRLIGTLKDFKFAHVHLSGDSWSMLLNRAKDKPRETRGGMVSAIGLFYEIHERLGWDFEDTLYRGIEEAYTNGSVQRDLPQRSVRKVNLNTQLVKQEGIREVKERIRQKVQNGERLTDREVRLALEKGDVEIKDALLRHFKNRNTEESRERWAEKVGKDAEQFAEEHGIN